MALRLFGMPVDSFDAGVLWVSSAKKFARSSPFYSCAVKGGVLAPTSGCASSPGLARRSVLRSSFVHHTADEQSRLAVEPFHRSLSGYHARGGGESRRSGRIQRRTGPLRACDLTRLLVQDVGSVWWRTGLLITGLFQRKRVGAATYRDPSDSSD